MVLFLGNSNPLSVKLGGIGILRDREPLFERTVVVAHEVDDYLCLCVNVYVVLVGYGIIYAFSQGATVNNDGGNLGLLYVAVILVTRLVKSYGWIGDFLRGSRFYYPSKGSHRANRNS